MMLLFKYIVSLSCLARLYILSCSSKDGIQPLRTRQVSSILSRMLSVLSMRVFEPIVKTHIPRFARVVEAMVILGQAIYSCKVLVLQLALQSVVVL
jgi:hypothetical protein